MFQTNRPQKVCLFCLINVEFQLHKCLKNASYNKHINNEIARNNLKRSKKFLKNKNIVVTGAAGLVGQNLIPLLINNGYRVTAIDRNNTNLLLLQQLNPGVSCKLADVSAPGDWETALEQADIVIQLHAQITAVNSQSFFRSNVYGVRNVVVLCAKHKIKHLIHLSSSVALTGSGDEYAETKRAGEEIVHSSKVPHTILRPPLMYGCFDAKHLGWIKQFMDKSFFIPIASTGRYIRQPLYVIDLCKVIIELTKRVPQNKIWNITGHEKIKYIEILRTIAKTCGLKRAFIPLPLWLFGLMLRMHFLITRKITFTPDQMKALVAGDKFPIDPWTEEFGVQYTEFEEGIWKNLHGENSRCSQKMDSPHQ
jgi:uncharacterized protein YbjT (DUF2867 family)